MELPHVGTVLVSAVESWGIEELRERLAFELFGERISAPAATRG